MRGAALPRCFTGVRVIDARTTYCLPSSAPVVAGFGTPSAACMPVQLVHGMLTEALPPFTLSWWTPNAPEMLGTEPVPAGRSTVTVSVAAPQPADETRGSPL